MKRIDSLTKNTKLNLQFFPLEKTRWGDFEKLLGERGACGGCWCMSWRLKSAAFEQGKGESNKKTMKGLVMRNEQVGLLAYNGDEPIAWCSVAPREQFVKLETSRVLKPVDDKPVWSISCMFIAKGYRRKVVSVALLKAVIEYCKTKNVHIIEGYPIIPYVDKMPDAFAWTGILRSYEKAGFVEVKRWSKARPIVRWGGSRK